MPTFSVIIPVYNGSDTICRAIDSVFAQSYKAYELIVVDDASKDDTVVMLEEKYGEKIKLVKKLVNQGSAAARNKGMDAATGEYFSFLDADDAWHMDKLMVLNTILSAQPSIVLFYHPFSLENILNKAIPETLTLYKLPFIKLLPGNFIATSCITLKNKPECRFKMDMRYMEDYELCTRIGYKYKIYFVNIPLTQIYRRFTSAGGISANKWKMRKGEMKVYMRLWRLNPLFLLLLPFLLISSLIKHLLKMVIKD